MRVVVSRGQIVAGCVILVVLAAVGWFVRQGAKPDSRVTSADAGQSVLQSRPTPEQGIASAVGSRGEGLGSETVSDLRGAHLEGVRSSGTAPERLVGRGVRVVDREGRPIHGAVVSWSSRHSLELGLALERDHRANSARSSHARTDSDGGFQLSASAPDVDGGGVLWVTHVDHGPAWVSIEHPSALPPTIALPKGGPLSVQVVDADGRAVRDAEVVTFLTDQPTSSEGADLDAAVHAAFVRIALTDGEGRAILPPAPAEQHVVAYSGNLRSAPFYGLAPAEIRLRVGEWSWVRGRVQAVGDVDLRVGVSVSTFTWTPAARKTIGKASVREDGTFGPTEVAHDHDLQLLLRLEGPGVLPYERVMPFPPAGSSTEVLLEAHPALNLTVRVVDDAEGALHLADLRAWWLDQDTWIHAHARTDADGLATLAIRPGQIHLQCQRRGFADVALPARTIERAPLEPLRIQLDRAGVFTGRVVRGGEPVPTFLVQYWTQDRSGSGSHHEQDRADGSFRVEGAPLGEVLVQVVEPGWPPSLFHRLIVVPGVESDLTIEMPARLTGRGQVVDASSGTPIGRGRVSTWIVEGAHPLQPTGVEASVGDEGRFELVGLAPGSNFLVIDVPGHAQLQRLVQAYGDSPLDLGRFGMVRNADLIVRLIGPARLDPTTCRVRISGTPAEQDRPFDADSTALFPGSASGRVQVTVTLPDGVQVRESGTFRGGVPGVLSVVIDDSERDFLEIQVDGLGDREGRSFVHCSTLVGPERRRERIVDLVEGRARIAGPFGEAVWIDLRDGTGSILMSRLLTRTDLESGRVVLQFEDERVSLRLLDRHREPLVGVVAHVESLPPAGWGAEGITDSTGRVVLTLPPRTRLYLHARFNGGGGVADVELPAIRGDGREIELVIDPNAELVVRFSDRGHALSGIRAFLFGSRDVRSLSLQGSDASGIARSGPIGSGAYRLDVHEHDVWPILEPIEVRPGSNERAIELRRLGGLRLTVQLPGGVPVEGAAIRVQSSEFRADVAEWIAQRQIPQPAGGLATDASGELRLAGIPNGPYVFTILAPDGRTASGQLIVPPHGEGHASVTLTPP